jgi:RimJ/RimL family protein N-acetyltransferase
MRATGEQIGFHLLNHIRGESIVQVGFILVRSAWGQGFGTEMASALLRYGFTDRELPRIAGMAHQQNLASQHVLTKIGLERRGERAFPHPDYASAGKMAWFERDREDWLADRSAPTSA